MKLTKNQKKELEVWEFFMPKNCKWLPKTDGDVKKFFEWSERGNHKDSKYGDLSYFEGLRQGKKWAGVHMGMYEEGVLDKSVPYFVLVEGMPRSVIDFMKKEMFQGMDAEIIEKCYV